MFQMKEQDKIPEEEQHKVCLSSLFDKKEFKLVALPCSSVGEESAYLIKDLLYSIRNSLNIL